MVTVRNAEPVAGDPAAGFLLSILGAGAAHALPAPDAERAVGMLRLHRLEGLAVARDREAGGGLLPPEVREALEPDYRARSLHGALLLESAGQARAALEEAGIPSLLFKGAALVRQGLYSDPGARAMDDVDLLVPTDAARGAAGALEGAGFRRWTGLGSPGWLDSATFDDPASPPDLPLVVDLHWRTEYGGMRFGDPTGGSVLWRDADLEAGLPAPGPHLVVVAEHLLKHLRVRTHLAAYADVARLAPRVEAWDEVVDVVRGRRLGVGIGLVLEAAARELGAPVPVEVRETLAGGGRSRRRTYETVRPGANLERELRVDGRLAGVRLRWRLMGSPLRAAGDLAEIAFPGGPWLRARYGAGGTLRLWLRYAADVLRWMVGRGRSPASPNQDVT